ncbi:hypothetical protein EYC84_001336 [Monilinia fructicola]|uniref:Major facilitator superfamily (MFS) profile domain-containing protein n=1 Tax=Monilinia fructicola TaxID=38448 RepID=A0A5M9JMY1_MONFR|nr:hypothetical protein EYC84_001336 [Monilinia fructicola]
MATDTPTPKVVDESPTTMNAVSGVAPTGVPAPADPDGTANATATAAEPDLENNDHPKPPKITGFTILVTLVVSLGGFIFGYDTGQISGFLEMPVFRERFGEPTTDLARHPSGFYFTKVRSGLIVGLLSIGTLIGCLAMGPLADKVGRRNCISICCVVFCFGVVTQIAVGSGEWVGIALGRCVAGLGIGGLSTVVPMYLAEVSPVHIRGALISSYQLFIATGMFVATCINFGTNKYTSTAAYRIPMGLDFIAPMILGIGMVYLPESPRYDWKKGSIENAKATMACSYGLPPSHPIIKKEGDEMAKALFSSSDSLPCCLNVVGNVFGVIMISHFTRRQCLCIAALVLCACMLIYASVGQFVFEPAAKESAQAKMSGIIMISFASFFIFVYAASWGPLVWTCNAEMFPTESRAVGMSFATGANWFWNFMLSFFTPFITQSIKFSYGYVFAGSNLLAFFVVYFFLHESSGKSLEEVNDLYVSGDKPYRGRLFGFSSPKEDSPIPKMDSDSISSSNLGTELQVEKAVEDADGKTSHIERRCGGDSGVSIESKNQIQEGHGN